MKPFSHWGLDHPPSSLHYHTGMAIILFCRNGHDLSVYDHSITGMRLTEQYSATWSQFDESRRAIDLTQTKNGTARTIHLNADALAAIESVRHPGQKPADRIFPREDHTGPAKRKLERFDTRSWFVPCLVEAKITGYVWHCNRHTFCSWLAMAGATIKEIQELAGHKTITMSARYAHLSAEQS
ncbi:MAG: site-specific integrase [Terracidiphilus sp.]